MQGLSLIKPITRRRMLVAMFGGGQLLALSACAAATAPPSSNSPKPLQLVASGVFVRDALLNITKDMPGVTVTSIVPAGTDPHDYEPTPKDAKLVLNASAIFISGAKLEATWLEKLIKSAGAQHPIIDLSSGITLAKIDPQFESEFDADPHYWQDPERWQQAIKTAANGVIALDVGFADAVKKNTAAYIAQIKALDAAIQSDIATIAPQKRILVTTHDAFGYYANRYGFKVVGTLIPAPNSATGAATPRNIKTLVDILKQYNVKAIFIEEGINPKLTEALAKEAGIVIIEKLYLDTLSDAKGPAATYLDMLQYNTRTIVEALK